MATVSTKAKWSEVMTRVRSRGNQDTELALAKLLRTHGITGWRRPVKILGRAVLPRGPNSTAAQQHRPTVRGRPDFVLRAARVVIFVDGCFGHRYPWHATQPKDNRALWRKKLAENQQRDRRAGWRVVRIWELVGET